MKWRLSPFRLSRAAANTVACSAAKVQKRCLLGTASGSVIRLSKLDTMQLASRVAKRANFFRAAGRRVTINIDRTGVGAGVVDRMRSLGLEVNGIGFGARALEPRKYANRRAEIWGLMKDWLAIGALPSDQDLATELCGVEYAFNTRDALQLESNASMRLGA